MCRLRQLLIFKNGSDNMDQILEVEYIDIHTDDNATGAAVYHQTWVSDDKLMQLIDGKHVRIKSEIDHEKEEKLIVDKEKRVPGSVWVEGIYVYFIDQNKTIQRAKFNNMNPRFFPHGSIT